MCVCSSIGVDYDHRQLVVCPQMADQSDPGAEAPATCWTPMAEDGHFGIYICIYIYIYIYIYIMSMKAVGVLRQSDLNTPS